MSQRNKLTTAKAALDYITGGKSKFTLVSIATGNRFTYTMKNAPMGEGKYNPDIKNIRVMTGADNMTSYTYFGRLLKNSVGDTWYYTHGVSTRITTDATSVRAFLYVFQRLVRGILPTDVEIWHEGVCGRCGRTLTVPESIENGFGPECIKRVNHR